MINLTIGENQGQQRLDRFLKKYFAKASLSYIYRLVRKDVQLNGRRAKPETMLAAGDELIIYISAEEALSLQGAKASLRAADAGARPRTKKQFTVVYEDENILIAAKPFGLLTHGDGREKKNHLANQVVDYLIEKGEYRPSREPTFTPAPANRLDRNTTGLVLFGKTASALKELNSMLRERTGIEKLYFTIASGCIKEELHLRAAMVKDESRNMAAIVSAGDSVKGDSVKDKDGEERAEQGAPQGKLMDTEVFPLAVSARDGGYTLAEVRLNTGRTHQIRLQLAAAGHPLIGDPKYGSGRVNKIVKQRYGLSTHLLHAGRLIFTDCRTAGPLSYLQGREFSCPLPAQFVRIKEDIFGKNDFRRK